MKSSLVAVVMSVLTTTCLSNSGNVTSVLERLPRREEETGGKVPEEFYRHPYLQEEFYARIAGLDLNGARDIIGKDHTIGVIEAKSSKFCHIESNGTATLEFPLSSAEAEAEADQSELVISLDAVAVDANVISGHVVSSIARQDVLPEVRNGWIVFRFRSTPEVVAASSGVLVVDLKVSGTAAARRRTCEGLDKRPPTLFLYRHFPPLPPPPAGESNPPGRRAGRSVPSHRSDCHLHPWTVDFDAIGMKRVIAPSLFKVNYCHGTCSDPAWSTAGILPRQPGPLTNHALLLIRAQAASQGALLPAPTCQPITYDSMNIIYLDQRDTVRVETFEQMVAASCGCGCK